MNEEYVSCAACLGSGKISHTRFSDGLFIEKECGTCKGKGYFENEYRFKEAGRLMRELGKGLMPKNNPIKPSHYHAGNIDVIKFSEENFEDVENKGFFRGNILKYVTRYDRKNGLEDLMKAEFYLQKLIEMERAKNKRGVSE